MPATPSLTRLFKSLREEKRERAIEDMLFDYPYLISPELASPKRQVELDSKSRGDLLFYLPTKVVAVEIKRGEISVSAVHQITRYLRRLHKKHKQVQGFLVGTKISLQADKAILSKKSWDITFRALGKDIPLEVVICRECRRARDQMLHCCPLDKCRETL